MTSFMKNDIELSPTAIRQALIAMMVLGAIFIAKMAFAQTGNSQILDDSLANAWDELQALATGNGGRILMIIMILGGIYFSVIAPNGMYFLGCIGGLLVLSNITELIDNALTASFDSVPAIGALLEISLQ